MTLYSTELSDALVASKLDTNVGTPSQSLPASPIDTTAGLLAVTKALWNEIRGGVSVNASEQVASSVVKAAISVTTASQTLMTSNGQRLGWRLYNKSGSGGTSYTDYGATASATDGEILPPGFERVPDFRVTSAMAIIGSAAHTVYLREFIK